LSEGKTAIYKHAHYPESFPVKIFQLGPNPRMIFTSTWRISKGQREFCVLSNRNNRFDIQVLTALRQPAATSQ
jgi:hypothetical protein